MIQQAINQGLSLAALVYSQTPGFKTKAHIQQIKGEGAKVNKVIAATENDTSPEGIKARTAAIERGKELSEERFAIDPSKKTFEQLKQNIAYAEKVDSRLTGEELAQKEAYTESLAAYEDEQAQEQKYFASESEKMAQRAQSHMAEKQHTKQRNYKNKSLRQKKKHGVI